MSAPPFRPCVHAVSRYARLVVHNGEIGTYQSIEDGALAHIRASHDGQLGSRHMGTGSGQGVGVNVGVDVGVDLGVGVDVGVDLGVNVGVDVGVDLGVG